MIIGIVGLGLMGASLAKALKKTGNHTVLGTDTNAETLKTAMELNIIHAPLSEENAQQVDLLVAAVFPRVFRAAICPLLPHMKKGATVTDFCGIKRTVIAQMTLLQEQFPQLFFVGTHPMAGLEKSGIENSRDDLFCGASAILVPISRDEVKLDKLKQFYLSLGFAQTVVCDADSHDANIAYTSQLCHVVSNAFVKSPTARKHFGYSAGSYDDLTRVAQMNSSMWAQLMTDNRDKLQNELELLIENLCKYKNALQSGDEQALLELLEEGNKTKLEIDL